MLAGAFRWLSRRSRWPFQLASAVLLNNYFLARWIKGVPCLALNCYSCPLASFACPVGLLQHFVIVRQFPLYVLGALGLSGALWGRAPCGWHCPFGAFQDMLHKVPGPKLRVRDRHGWIRYVVLLVLVFVIPWFTLAPWFCKLCPQGTIEAGIPWVFIDPAIRAQIGWLFWLKVGLLLVMMGSAVVVRRPFCRWACPLGAVWSPFNKVSALRLEVDKGRCKGCGLCGEACPMGIVPHKSPNSLSCIRCLRCVRACPTGALKVA